MAKEKKAKKNHLKEFFSDFKKFITKGNIVDLAVAVVIGGAFNKIVSSLVAQIITPIISLATGNVNFVDLKWVLREAVLAEDGAVKVAEIAIGYGQFFQYIIDFLIIGLTVFVMVKLFTHFKKKLDFNANMCEEVQEKFNKGEELNEFEKRWYKRFKKRNPDLAPKTLEEQAAAAAAAAPAPVKAPEPTATEKLLQEILEEIKSQKEVK